MDKILLIAQFSSTPSESVQKDVESELVDLFQELTGLPKGKFTITVNECCWEIVIGAGIKLAEWVGSALVRVLLGNWFGETKGEKGTSMREATVDNGIRNLEVTKNPSEADLAELNVAARPVYEFMRKTTADNVRLVLAIVPDPNTSDMPVSTLEFKSKRETSEVAIPS